MSPFPLEGRSKLRSVGGLKEYLRKLRRSGKKIVFTNGCFDILHVGHARYLHQARKLGDALVIGINTDASVRKLKGQERPVNSQRDRAEVLGSLACVDCVVLFGEPTPMSLIQRVRPDVLVKGGDWKKKDIVGGDFVESCGGRVISLPHVRGFSTTAILQTIKKL